MIEAKPMKLALFDFDGTITSKDSFSDFLKFAVGPTRYKIGFVVLVPLLIGYKLKLINDAKAKELVLTYFFKGWESERFFKMIADYSKNHLHRIIKKSAMDKIYWHQQQGHRVVVVSAALDCMMKEWCDSYNLELIGTTLEVVDGKITGKLLGKNCYGIEKVNRVKELCNLDEYDYIYAYGDSQGDKEMLELADEKFFRYFE